MRYIKLILFFLILLPFSYGFVGGDIYNESFSKCDFLKVNITGSLNIDVDEYQVLNPECVNNFTNYYECDCHDNYLFKIKFALNTINTYNISYFYNYINETNKPSPPPSGGGGGSRRPKDKDKGNWLVNAEKEQNNSKIYKPLPKVLKNKTVIVGGNISETVPNHTDVTFEIRKDKSSFMWFMLLGMIFTWIIILIIMRLKNKKEKKRDLMENNIKNN